MSRNTKILEGKRERSESAHPLNFEILILNFSEKYLKPFFLALQIKREENIFHRRSVKRLNQSRSTFYIFKKKELGDFFRVLVREREKKMSSGFVLSHLNEQKIFAIEEKEFNLLSSCLRWWRVTKLSGRCHKDFFLNSGVHFESQLMSLCQFRDIGCTLKRVVFTLSSFTLVQAIVIDVMSKEMFVD